MNHERVDAFMRKINPYGTGVKIGMEKSNVHLYEQVIALMECVEPVNPKGHYRDRFVWIRSKANGKDERWYGLYLAEQKDYQAVLLNQVLLINPRQELDEKMDMGDFLLWIIEELKWCIEMLQKGTYNDYIRDNLPYEHRAGVIRRKEYWRYVPRDKKRTLGDVDEHEKKEFLAWHEQYKEESGYGMKCMTSGEYFETCDVLYELFGKREEEYLTPIEKYKKYADGRDNGLAQLDVHSKEQFEEWYAIGFFDHAWDLCWGKAASLRLFRRDDGCYYFDYYDKYVGETIHYALELIKHGYVLCAAHYNAMVQEMQGEDMITICPQGCGVIYYERGAKEILRASDCRLLPETYPKEMIEAIVWYDIPEVKLLL